MFGFFKSTTPAKPGHTLRSRLSLEELGTRAVPDGNAAPTPPANPIDPGFTNPPPVVAAPVIDRFDPSEVAHGWYQITGHVTAANVAGLVVRFDGIPALIGRTATCDANGNFTLVFQVQTNGNDRGTVSAQTTDANGRDSNLALAFISPTP